MIKKKSSKHILKKACNGEFLKNQLPSGFLFIYFFLQIISAL